MAENNVSAMIMSGLTFDKAAMKEACGKKKFVQTAIYLLAFSVLLDAVLAYFLGNAGNSGLAGMKLMGMSAALAGLGSSLIGTFLSAWIMVYVLKIFKVSMTYDQVLTVYGAAIIWTIIGSLFGLTSGVIAMIVGVFAWLAYNFVVLFGLAACGPMKLWQSFLSIVITFIVVFIVMILYGSLVGMIF